MSGLGSCARLVRAGVGRALEGAVGVALRRLGARWLLLGGGRSEMRVHSGLLKELLFTAYDGRRVGSLSR